MGEDAAMSDDVEGTATIGCSGARDQGSGRVVRRARLRIAAVLGFAALMLIIPSSSLGVHDTGAFELDGNAITDHPNAGSPDDWDRVCHQKTGGNCSTTFNTSGATAIEWASDGALNATIFTGGGSKDPEDIPDWAWKTDSGGLPDKDNLLHSFAARYSLAPSATCPSGGAPTCDVLYFGSDRYDNSGDAQQGFWFFQNPVGLGSNSVGGGTGFTGTHAPGDLLIISDFSNGGGTSTITVYKWDPVCTAANNPASSCADANLRTLASSAAANCATAGPADPFCGLVNPTDGTVAPWPFVDKSGFSTYLQGEFFEGGINLSVLGLSHECFASVASETRSSTSTTAVLKDFVLGNFGHCESGLRTTPKTGSGLDIPPGGLSIGTGSVSVKDSADLTITGAGTWSGTLKFFLCKVDAPATCTSPNGTQVGATQNVDQDTVQPMFSAAATVTAAGRYCWRGEFTATTAGVPNSTDDTEGECFIVNPVTPTLTTNATTAVGLGTAIGDSATLSGTANQPGNPIINGPLGAAAGGTITFRAFGPSDPTCANAPAFTSAPVAVSGDGTYGPVSFTPTVPGTYRWIASYSGNLPNTLAQTGACNDANETSIVVDANIQITPDGVNRVGDTHTFTAHVNVNDGTGFTNAPDGTTINFTVAGPGTFSAAPAQCVTSGGTGSCTIGLTANVTGVSVVTASTSVLVGGVSVTRSTNGVGANSGPATKRWVDAKISIAASATNEVGDPHTFTVTLQKDIGDGNGFGAAAGEHVNFTLTDSNGAVSVLDAAASTCDDAGANTDAGGQCTIVFTSNSAGQVTGHASSTLSVAGSANFTVATDGVAPNSGDAVKTFVDANIQISPQSATNPLSTNHTLTGHVNVNTGSGGFQNAPNGTTITFSLVNAGGATASFVGPSSCTTAGGTGSCDVVISSSTAGTTTIKASTDVTVGGVTLHRESGDGKLGDSADATKNWAAARISIAPDATNEIGDPHTFTVTLEKDTGTGAFVAAAGEHVDFTLTDSLGAASVLDAASSTCDDAGANTDANGQCTIVFTSPSAGKVTGHASASLQIGGATVVAQTNGAGGSSGDAVKTFVDANIQIAPDGVNRIGDTHTFTAHVNVNDGSGFANASGKLVTFSIDSGPGVLSNGNVSSTSCTTNANGNCTIDLDSATTGVTKVSAHTTFLVGGVSLTRNTDGTAANSSPATKTWVNAKISIAQDATNAIGDPHTFTVTLTKDPGTGTFVTAAGEHVGVTLTDTNGAASVVDAAASTCDDAGANTNANGQCTITFTSQTPGKVTAHASSTLSVAGSANFTVETDGVAPNSGDAVKTFVDANIQITPPSAINPVSTNHTLVGHVNVNTGTGGFVNAPNGTTIGFTLSGAGSFVGPNSCITSGGTGSCSVVISSSTVGSSTVRAKTDVVVGGLTLHRETGDAKAGDGADAVKLWADATARTDILNASGAVVTTVVSGTIVHDKVFVDRVAGTPAAVPNPTGNVIFHRYATIDCTGTAVDQTVALTPGAPSTAITDDFAPTSDMSYRAEYLGDANYPARTGACEPLTVTPVPNPLIAIVKNPKSQTVAVGGTATFTITVTNAGNVVLTDVTVTDPLSPNCNRTKAQIPALASMAPGAKVSYTCTRPNVRGSFDNVATAIGTPPTGPNVTASDTAPVKAQALKPAKKKAKKKTKKPKVVSHKKPKATG
jgi:uncharacterized repeat protein (TIGR01451 family)